MSDANPSECEKTSPRNQTSVRPKTADADGNAAQDQRLRRRTMRVERRKFSQGAAVRLQAHLEITPDINGVPSLLALKTEPLTIGRNRDCGLCLPLENVSRQHARIYFFNDEYHVADTGSTNGTFVNGVQISRCMLRSDDLIEIGEAQIYFVEERVRQ